MSSNRNLSYKKINRLCHVLHNAFHKNVAYYTDVKKCYLIGKIDQGIGRTEAMYFQKVSR